MAGCSGKLKKSAEELGAADTDPGFGGGQSEGIWDVLQGVCAGSVAFWVRDVGPDPPHGTVPGNFPTQGHAADHMEAAYDTGGEGMGLLTA